MLFTGEYEHTIDSKQRLAVPADIRSRMDSRTEGAAFYIAPGPNGALWLWPERAFERMAERIEQSLLPAEELMEFDELTFPEARRLDMDNAGRIRLPERMIARAGLGQNVLIVGMRDHLELRDPQEWENLRQQRHARRREIMLRARESHLGRPTLSSGGKEEGP